MRSIGRLGPGLAAVCLLSAARPSAGQQRPNDSLDIAATQPSVAVLPFLPPAIHLPLAIDTPVVRRPRAIEYSDAYYTRLTIHRYGSYAMIPLLVAEYSLGQNLMNDAPPPTWMKPAHGVVAGGVAVLFGLNTITGVWNLWESRSDPAGRTRRIVYSVMLIVADAGFAATGATAPEHDDGFRNYNDFQHRVRVHRDLAIGSVALSTIGGGMMWFWKQ
jgi:hypothetical protein